MIAATFIFSQKIALEFSTIQKRVYPVQLELGQ